MFIKNDTIFVKKYNQNGKILDKIWTTYGNLYIVQLTNDIVEVEETQLEKI